MNKCRCGNDLIIPIIIDNVEYKYPMCDECEIKMKQEIDNIDDCYLYQDRLKCIIGKYCDDII